VPAHLGLISPTFYAPLLQAQIPKAMKDTDDLTVFVHFWDMRMAKAARKHVGGRYKLERKIG